MDKSAKISVLMPVYNETRYLPAAIESILDQTWRDFEFIIIDDHSTDETARILARYREQDARIQVYRRGRELTYHSNATAYFNSFPDDSSRIITK